MRPAGLPIIDKAPPWSGRTPGQQAWVFFPSCRAIQAADNVQTYKYVCANRGRRKYGRTATFMPSGVGRQLRQRHSHVQAKCPGKAANRLFSAKGPSQPSPRHGPLGIGAAEAMPPYLLAFTNPPTNSLPSAWCGFRSAVNLVYSRGQPAPPAVVASRLSGGRPTGRPKTPRFPASR